MKVNFRARDRAEWRQDYLKCIRPVFNPGTSKRKERETEAEQPGENSKFQRMHPV